MPLHDALGCAPRPPHPGAALGIMGGTFDPPHLGHLALARAARDELSLDGVLWVPAGTPSFKRDRHVTCARDRLHMLSLMLEGDASFSVSRIETDRPGVTYSVDTLEELRRIWPAPSRLVFIMGADSLRTLPHWRRASRILELAEIAVAGRAGEELTADLAAVRAFAPDACVHVLGAAPPRVSSTQLRLRLARGEDVSDLVDGRVLEYIRLHGLYARQPDRETRRCDDEGQ